MKKINYTLIMWVFIAAYFIYFGLISILRFNSYSFYDFDLAVHDLTMWNIVRGSTYNSILGVSFLGNHMQLVMFLVAPVYALFNSPFTLLLLQTLFLALTAYPLFKLAARLLDEGWALVIGVVYLIYPALGYLNLFEFHPPAFATFFLVLTYYFYELGNYPRFLIFAALAMSCQENIPLAIIMFGILAIFNRRSLKWIIVPLLAGLVYFLIATSLMAYFSKNTIQFMRIYGHLGDTPLKVILNILSRPALLAKLFLRREFGIYCLQLFLPVSFINFLNPLTLLPALPFFIQHTLSKRPQELTIFFQYTAEIIPFIFISFIYGLKTLTRVKFLQKYQIWIKVIVLLMAFLSNIYLGPHFGTFPHLFSGFQKDSLDRFKDAVIAKIPADTPVMATFEFLPHLTHRRNLYSFHHLYMGFYTLSDKAYEPPKDVEYAIIDFNDVLTFSGFYSPDNYKNIQRLLYDDDLRVQDCLDSIVLFKRGGSGIALFQAAQPDSLDIENKMQVSIEDDIEFLGYTSRRQGNIEELFLYWKCLRPTQRDISVFFDVVDASQGLIMRKTHPLCYRVFPTNGWRQGEIFKEYLRLYIPPALWGKHYKLMVGFFDHRNNSLCRIEKDKQGLARIFLKELE